MKKTRFITIVTAAALLVLASCKPIEDPLAHLTDGVTVTTRTPDYISGTTAVCGAEVTAEDDGLLIEIGVCWSKSGNPTIDNNVMKSPKFSQPYTCLMTNLEPNTKYHVRGYAKYGTEYCYGDEKTFTTTNDTIAFPNLLTTTPATNITGTGFTAGGNLATIDHNLNFRIYGICYSTSPTPTADENSQSVWDYYYFFTNPFQIHVYDLLPNTQYYYRAFVGYYENGDSYDFIYGDILTLTTPDTPLELEVYTNHCYYDYWDNTIAASGEIYCNKPEVINQVGFCYSIENEFPQYESDMISTVATPTGSWNWQNFYGSLQNLSANNKYYIRSFARYSTGNMTDSIKYGNVVSVNTYY